MDPPDDGWGGNEDEIHEEEEAIEFFMKKEITPLQMMNPANHISSQCA
jgi:hypothetical protein